MSKGASRTINPSITQELWVRAGGRCQFQGCNKLLYKFPIMQEKVKVSQRAHIFSYSENGARGWGLYKENSRELNKVENLML